MTYPHIFGIALKPLNRIPADTIAISFAEVAPKVFLKAMPSLPSSFVRSSSISGKNEGAESRASREPVDSYRSEHGQIQPGSAVAIPSAGPGNIQDIQRTLPEFAVRNQWLLIEEYER